MLAIRVGYISRETPKAIMVELGTGDMRGSLRDVWLPKSQIDIYYRQLNSSDDYLIVVPEWLNQAKHLMAEDPYELDLDKFQLVA